MSDAVYLQVSPSLIASNGAETVTASVSFLFYFRIIAPVEWKMPDRYTATIADVPLS